MTQTAVSLSQVILLLVFAVGVFCAHELNLIGLLPFEGGWAGGYDLLKACQLALKHINANPNILNGYELKVRWSNTKCEQATGLDVLYQELYRPPKKIMVLGAACSTVTEATAMVSWRWNLVQMSHISSSPALQTRDKYKRLFTIIKSQENFCEPRLALLKYYGWKKITVVYQMDKIFALTLKEFEKMTKEAGIEMKKTAIISDNLAHNIQLLKNTDCRIIIVELYEDIARNFFCEAYKRRYYGPHIVWILNGWYTLRWWEKIDNYGSCNQDQILQVIQGAFYFKDYFSKTPVPTVSGYLSSIIRKDIKQISSVVDWTYGTYAYDSVWAAALVVNKTINDLKILGINKSIDTFTYDNNFIGELMFNNTKTLKFHGATGKINFEKQTKVYSNYSILVIKDNETHMIGTIDFRSSALPIIHWHSKYMDSFIWTDGKVPGDSIPVLVKYLLISTVNYIIISCVASLGILLTLYLIVFSIKYRNERMIKISSPRLNLITLFGCLLLYSSVFVENPYTELDSFKCQLKAFLIIAGFSLTFGPLFAIQWRVYKIFTTGTKKRIKFTVFAYVFLLPVLPLWCLKKIKDSHLIFSVLILFFVNMVVFIIWSATDPLQAQSVNVATTHYSDKKPSISKVWWKVKYEKLNLILKCSSPKEKYFLTVFAIIQSSLLLLGLFLAVQTRHVRMKGLRNAETIGFSIYNVIVLVILEVILNISLQKHTNLRYTLSCAIIIIGTFVLQCFTMLPKIRRYRKRFTGEIEKATTNTSKATEQLGTERQDFLEIDGIIKRHFPFHGTYNIQPIVENNKDSKQSDFDDTSDQDNNESDLDNKKTDMKNKSDLDNNKSVWDNNR